MSKEVELSEESRRVLTQCFAQYDTNGNGSFDSTELPKALEFAGVCFPTMGEIDFIKKTFDTSGDQRVQVKELVDNWQVLAQHSVNGLDLMEAFEKLDTNHNGYITERELKIILTQKGEKWSLDEVRELLKHLAPYDKDHDGKFSYPEFVEMFRTNVYPFKRPDEYQKTDVTKRYEMKNKD